MAPQEKTEVQAVPDCVQAGMQLAHPPPGEEIVISGVAGYFPESENMYDLRDNLMNKVDMVTDDDRRWKLDHPEIPQRTGKLLNVNKFDASFFGVHFKQAHTMDPMCRMLLERTFEAVVDAGINPRHLKGQRIGVFIGACFSESEKTWFYEKLQVNGFGITGCSRAMLANRISYWLGINGPSYTVDSACSSSLYALEHAYKSIRDGHCQAAIVGGCNLCLHPYVSLQFSRLGVLNPQGMCKSFDRDANGYTRSEAISVIFLQKACDAKRVYATVVHAKSNCDGYKEQGITYPSGQMQKALLEEFYNECAISPTLLGYIEAHGTGTKVGDPEELNALDQVFCKGRKTPLLIGSVKSNLGHAEPASGLCSVAKVLIAMETGIIPPNLHYYNPREGVEALAEGRLKVVTEKCPLNSSLVGINSFGFGGANAHILLQWNQKNKINGGAPTDTIPRLVVASGRTQEAVNIILKDFESRSVDAEYVSLMHNLQSAEIPGHIYRGYALLTQDGRKLRSIQYYPGSKRPVWFVFTGMGSQWPGMGKALLNIPIFAAAIEKCQKALKPHGVDLFNIITTEDPSIFDNILNCFVGIAACQVGLVDILKAVGIEADGIVGHSVGELGCSYMDGCFTAEQMVLAAYYRGRASLETKLIHGLMAAVALGAQEAKQLCPPDIEVACHNGPNFCTLSGPTDSMKNFLKTLQQQHGVFAKEVNCANIAYHSKYIASAGPALLKYLRELIPNPKPRSARWVSSSVPRSLWNTPLATHSSAEYHTNNLLSTVLFEEASKHIPANAITIEIAPHGLLQAILHRSLNKATTNIALTQRGHSDCSELLLTALGRLYELGLQPQLANLYPPVQYPVSRGTPMISPLIRWEHSEDWYVTSYRMQEKMKSGERSVVVTLDDEEMEYLSGHVIDGRNLFPAMGYLALVWESVGLMAGQLYTEVSVVFKNVQFHRATNIPKEGNIEFIVMVQKGSGKFEVVEGSTAIVSGSVHLPENISREIAPMEPPKPVHCDELLELTSRDIYKELRLRGYNYQGYFRSLLSADNLGRTGKIHWRNNWVAFMDNMLQLDMLSEDTRSLFVPTSLEKLTINTKQHVAIVQALAAESEEVVIPVHVYKEVGIIQSGGIEVRGVKASAIARRRPLGVPVLEKYMFVPNVEPPSLDLHTALRMCIHIVLENQLSNHVKAVELPHHDRMPLSPTLALILGDLPLIQADITILTNQDNPLVADLDMTGIKVEDRKLLGEQNCMLVIASNVLHHTKLLQTAVSALADGACILTRENSDTKYMGNNRFGFEVVFEKTLGDEKFVLLRKGVVVNNPVVIHVSAQNYDWLPQIQAVIDSSSKRRIILVAQNEPLNGILGLVNCIRKEPGGEPVRCVFILDESAPPFDLDVPLYYQQLNKDLVINVYSNGHWGSYRHLPLDNFGTVTVPHAFVNATTRGDLSTLKWLEGSLQPDSDPSRLVHVYYSALNFRDVMTATGKLGFEVFSKSRLNQYCIQGLEFSGRTVKGQRVMGMGNYGSMGTMVMADNDLLWNVPEHWTLEEAATIPVVYGTVYYGLVLNGRMKKGESVLIHAGSGGVGQAAINICLHTGCTVFTTVGTEEKREFIKKQFPQLTDRNIGNSRDTSFEQLIMLETNGRGVDLVLNSLSDEKLQASLRCLATGGRFLEIGKADLVNNKQLGMEIFLKETSFHGVMLDYLFSATSEKKKVMHDIIAEGIKSGAVKPLVRNVFTEDEIEQAFRYMAAGKHIGKVLLKIREEEDRKLAVPSPRLIQASPQYYCNPAYTYIIAGGLGGFGLELADWLVLRGARKLVLTSRYGLKTGYQSLRVRIWRSYGVTVVISVADITTRNGVAVLLSDANKLGPVDAIFNLAVVLRDALLENQSEADFAASAGPKAHATQYLDELSRQMCPQLRHFVVFSSVSCGRGNAGQTNYGMSNSVMERICEARVRDGLPGLAIQWGAVGDVGLVADMQEDDVEVVIGGTLQQKISSCLEELNGFMKQPYPIVASMVVAEKHRGSGESDNIVDCVSNILGIRDLKTVSQHSTLAELGMDSMMAVEIKQSLEREFEVFLTAQEIRGLTFARLEELSAAKQGNETTSEEQPSEAPAPVNEVPLEGLELLVRVIGDEVTAAQPVLRLPSATGAGEDIEDVTKAGPVLFMIPGVEGMGSILKPLAKNLKYQALCLQLGYTNEADTAQDMAQALLPHIQSRLAPDASFSLLGYSFGGILAMELAMALEAEGREGHLYLVDSSPDFLQCVQERSIGNNEDQFEINLMCVMFNLMAPHEATPAAVSQLVEKIKPLRSWDERLEHFIMMLPKTDHSVQHLKAVGAASYVRLKAMANYKWGHETTIKSHTTLLRSTIMALKTEEDYGLSKYCDKKVEVHFVVGNHVTLLDNKHSATIINRQAVDNEATAFKNTIMAEDNK